MKLKAITLTPHIELEILPIILIHNSDVWIKVYEINWLFFKLEFLVKKFKS